MNYPLRRTSDGTIRVMVSRHDRHYVRFTDRTSLQVFDELKSSLIMQRVSVDDRLLLDDMSDLGLSLPDLHKRV
jgi:hypothetical protein